MGNDVRPTDAKPDGREDCGDVGNGVGPRGRIYVPEGPRETRKSPQELREAPEWFPVKVKPSACKQEAVKVISW